MKTYSVKFFSAILAMAVILLVLYSGCKKKNNGPDVTYRTYTAMVQLNGSNEVPVVTTTGTGTANITYNEQSKTIAYTITWQLGSAAATTTGMHFHGAENGSNLTSSPIVIEIPGFTTASSGTLTGTTRVLNAAEISQLLSGKWYVNIHSSDFTSGEIRGNIVLVAASTGNGGNNGGGGGY
ncbi:CHRD domain-containing protein [Pedobacter panaciterrae]|uniref:CHRD domain-containing protein n=1 Tax=Pedobacter panaciterrae TaxID=363849 RepID=UPI002597FCC1|nr:CHRD domain-containing protein [uncultured Pedobacter sp.]